MCIIETILTERLEIFHLCKSYPFHTKFLKIILRPHWRNNFWFYYKISGKIHTYQIGLFIWEKVWPFIDQKRLGHRWVKRNSLSEILCGRLQLVHSGNQPNDMCSPTISLCLLFVCVCESKRQTERENRSSISDRRAHHWHTRSPPHTAGMLSNHQACWDLHALLCVAVIRCEFRTIEHIISVYCNLIENKYSLIKSTF